MTTITIIIIIIITTKLIITTMIAIVIMIMTTIITMRLNLKIKMKNCGQKLCGHVTVSREMTGENAQARSSTMKTFRA